MSTIKKFASDEESRQNAVLSRRGNVIVIVDDARRGQLGALSRNMRSVLPGAVFIGFTDTLFELGDHMKEAFGEYISTYDIRDAVIDKIAVPVYYESRGLRLGVNHEALRSTAFDLGGVFDNEESDGESEVNRFESVVSNVARVDLVSRDIASHFAARLAVLDGKGMIVALNRGVCVAMYEAIIRLRPDWHSDDDREGAVKVIIGGSVSDSLSVLSHVRSRPRRDAIVARFSDPDDPLKLVIIRDMLLTGVDVPSLHTLYVDRNLSGHELSQAVARVNRVFFDKPAGLIVDYIGLARSLRHRPTSFGGPGYTWDGFDQERAVERMMEKYETCRRLLDGLDWTPWSTGTSGERLQLLADVQEHILSEQTGKARFVESVSSLSQAFAAAVPSDEATRVTSDMAFFQTIRRLLIALEVSSTVEHRRVVRDVASALTGQNVLADMFSAIGLTFRELPTLSDEFLAGIQQIPQHRLAIELLRSVLTSEVTAMQQRNVVRARFFSSLLLKKSRAYESRDQNAVSVMRDLITLALQMRTSESRSGLFEMTEYEMVIYDALEASGASVREVDRSRLKSVAREIAQRIGVDLPIDWINRESVRAEVRVRVKRTLRQSGYPLELRDGTAQAVVEQIEVFQGSLSVH